MSAATREVLLNREVIAVDQDSAGHQGHRIAQSGDLEVWAKPLADGGQAVALFNRGAATATMTVHWIELGLSGALTVRDLWAHQTRSGVRDGYSAPVPSHGLGAREK
jgi:alpha-galactosidase